MQIDIVAALINVLLLVMLTTPHEWAHAWVATRLGDDTPMLEGRVTLHPLAHVDWLGTVILPFVTTLLGAGLLGWGKPVRTDPSKLRGGLNGLALVSLAGPASNLIMTVILGAIAAVALASYPSLAGFAFRGARLSLYLALLNMIPVPPLDGSKLLLAARLPMRLYVEVARYGFMLLIVLISMTSVGPLMSQWSDEGALAAVRLWGVRI